jgi:hypothetical protein
LIDSFSSSEGDRMSIQPSICSGILLLSAAGALHAQEAGGPQRTNVFFVGRGPHEEIVKNAPYCADAVRESVQLLADGNRIVQTQQSRLCRDGEGRTRQDVERGGRRVAYLHDPGTRQSWLLDPERKTVHRLDRPDGPPLSREGGSPPGVLLGKHVAGAPGPQGPMPVRILIRHDGAGEAMPLPPLPPLDAPPPVALQAALLAPRGPGVKMALPAQEMEGVKANGERTTWTIEAGKIGNAKPIVITQEVWRSPELMLTLKSRDADPRSAQVDYRLVNLKRGEPDPALMKVPGDYRPAAMPGPPDNE